MTDTFFSKQIQWISYCIKYQSSYRQGYWLEMEDKLTEINKNELGLLRDLYDSERFEKNYMSFMAIDNYMSWFKQNPGIKHIRFFCLNGNLSNGTFIVTVSCIGMGLIDKNNKIVIKQYRMYNLKMIAGSMYSAYQYAQRIKWWAASTANDGWLFKGILFFWSEWSCRGRSQRNDQKETSQYLLRRMLYATLFTQRNGIEIRCTVCSHFSENIFQRTYQRLWLYN